MIVDLVATAWWSVLLCTQRHSLDGFLCTFGTITYSRNFSREKAFTNFTVLKPPAKVFSSKFGQAIVPTYVRF